MSAPAAKLPSAPRTTTQRNEGSADNAAKPCASARHIATEMALSLSAWDSVTVATSPSRANATVPLMPALHACGKHRKPCGYPPSVDLGAGLLHHRSPALDLGALELRELLLREGRRVGAVGNPDLLHLGRVQCLLHFGVEP